MGAVAWLVADSPPLLDITPTAWERPSPTCPLVAWLTQAAGAEAVVSPRRRLGLVAVEDLLHKLLHREARAAVPIAARPLDAVDGGERGGRGGEVRGHLCLGEVMGRMGPEPSRSVALFLLAG